MSQKSFTLQEMKNAFIAGEKFQEDYTLHEEGNVETMTELDFGDWIKSVYNINVEEEQ